MTCVVLSIAHRVARHDPEVAEQHDDGGWDVDWKHWSPAGGLEWRGWATVRAVRILRAHGRL
jgi:hypothetical protein